MLMNWRHLVDLWHRASRSGTESAHDYPSRRRIVMVNQSALLGAMITLVYGLLSLGYAPVTLWPMLAATPLLFAGYVAVGWLNRRIRHLSARALLIVVPTIQVTFAAWLFGNDAGVQLYFFVLWTSMFLLYAPQDRWLSATSGTLWIALFIWVQLQFDTPWLTLPQGQGFIPLLLLLNSLGVFCLVGVIVVLFYLQINRTETQLQREYQRSESLLTNILPASVAQRLKDGSQTVADSIPQATLLFADIVGFTRLAENLPPHEVVALLNRVFSRFDALVERHGLEKIKTIGDEYMLAGGLPERRSDHAQAVARVALAMIDVIEDINRGQAVPLALRVGMHSGEVVAGVIGSRKFSYDVWGDTVNIASRMQSQGLPGRIQLTEATRNALPASFHCERRGTLRVRGKGRMPTWFLISEDDGHAA